jgi:hypothetical protein
MKATVGDRLVVGPRRVGLPRRRAEIVEVLGRDGTPPFRVRWPEDGRVSLVVPSAEMLVEPGDAAGAATEPSARLGEGADPELRLARLEESRAAMGRQLERLREDVRALDAAFRG